MTDQAIASLRGKIEERLDGIASYRDKDESYRQLLRIYHELALGPNLTRSIEDRISTLPLLLGTAGRREIMNSVMLAKRPHKLADEKVRDGYTAAGELFSDLSMLATRSAEVGQPRYGEAVWIRQDAFGFNVDLTIGQVLEAGYAFGLLPCTYELPAACVLARPPGPALCAAEPHGDRIFEITAERENELAPVTYHLQTRVVTKEERFPSTTYWVFWREMPQA